MRWKVEGTSRETGNDVTAVVDAPNEAAAREAVKRKGIVVERVTETGPTPEAIPYSSPALEKKDSPAVPKYTGLTIVATICRVTAFLYYILAAIGLAAGVIGAMNRRESSVILEGISLAAGALMAGIVLHFLSAASEALRDMARNSWHR